MQQIQGMLEDAGDWCHSREVFVQFEAGTYQVQARAAPARGARDGGDLFLLCGGERGRRPLFCVRGGCTPQRVATVLMGAGVLAGGVSHSCAPRLCRRRGARLSAAGGRRS
eukprot:scaffold5506_cov114-Isochrysis_galbana.AAC.4